MGTAAAALLIALFSGVGESLTDRLIVWLEGSQAAELDQAKAPPQDAGPRGSPESEADPAPIGEIVIFDEPICVSAVGTAPIQRQACGDAVRRLARQAERQCDRITIEQGGSSKEIVDAVNQCTSCAVAGGEWRCVAEGTPRCVISRGE